jgi:hypothetical protein
VKIRIASDVWVPLESELAEGDLGLDRGRHQGQGGLRSSLRLVLVTRAQGPEAVGSSAYRSSIWPCWAIR